MKLKWTEAILSLTMTLVSVSSHFLPGLTDNGLVSTLLTVITGVTDRSDGSAEMITCRKRSDSNTEMLDCSIFLPNVPNRSYLRIYIESLAIQVLDMAINSHPQTLTTFKEMHGKFLFTHIYIYIYMLKYFHIYLMYRSYGCCT